MSGQSVEMKGTAATKEKIEQSLAEVSSRAGMELRLKNVSGGVVTLEYHTTVKTCAIKTGASGSCTAEKEMILELLQDQLKEKLPEITKIVIE